MKTLIVTASEIEAEPIKNYFSQSLYKSLGTQPNLYFLSDELGLCVTGVGKINSLINTQLVLEKYNVEQIVVLGIGGGPPSLKIGDVCIATSTLDGDIGYFFDNGERERLKFPVSSLTQETSHKLIEQFKKVAERTKFEEIPREIQDLNQEFQNTENQVSVLEGPIVTGDCFYHGSRLSKYTGNLIKEKFGAKHWLTDMESHALVSLANSKDIPILVVKAMSNYDQPFPSLINKDEDDSQSSEAEKRTESIRKSFKAGGLNYAINNSAKLVLSWLKEKT
ncbi:MAG: 5'-methylthioadenosine/S-adenosylhomocysteine nucleosidase [Candidatus Caenarcaniphilales bacterium]|nr:5'-methylthioadenosine/S-adenosylhomocysteine nucleosidase [Candidatus Caenarcaniphilales bacterium]